MNGMQIGTSDFIPYFLLCSYLFVVFSYVFSRLGCTALMAVLPWRNGLP